MSRRVLAWVQALLLHDGVDFHCYSWSRGEEHAPNSVKDASKAWLILRLSNRVAVLGTVIVRLKLDLEHRRVGERSHSNDGVLVTRLDSDVS